MKPAGFENSQGIISSAYLKDTSDPQWKDDAGMKAFDEFLAKYFPEGNRVDASVMYGYTVAQGLVHVLKACGDDLTRANIMKQAASINGLELGGLLPGIKVKPAPPTSRRSPSFSSRSSRAKNGTCSARSSAVTLAASHLEIRSPHNCSTSPPRACSRGFSFAAIGWITGLPSVNRRLLQTMTDRRPLLRAIFDAAVAAAHPDVVLSAHLRPVPGAA